MEKKCFFKLSTNTGIKEIVVDLPACLAWIKNDADCAPGESEQKTYTLTPVWLTDDEFRKLPEAEV